MNQRKTEMLGCNLKPGHRPGGFPTVLSISKGELNRRRKPTAYQDFSQMHETAKQFLEHRAMEDSR